MENLFERKSIFAKLLAQENVHVTHGKVKTAYFDLKTRTMVLPNWSDITPEMYDLLSAHEVSHALHTPLEGWHNAVVDNAGLKSYLNVLEDVRIERKIKEKYPGLRRSFNVAYKILLDRGFFGLEGLNIKTLRFIDRINIFYKLGGHLRVGFSESELKILDRINKMETWEDVETLARELYNAAKEEQKNKPKPDDSDDSEDGEDGEDGDDYDDFEDSEEDNSSDSDMEDEDDSDYGDSSDDSDLSDDGNEEDSENQDDGGNVNKSPIDNHEDDDSIEDPVSSITDKAFRLNEKNLIENENVKVVTALVPSFYDDVVIPYSIVQSTITNYIEKIKVRTDTVSIYSTEIQFNKILNRCRNENYKDFISRSRPMVDYMVKEFEMRKSASEFTRTKTSKSGEIDSNKLSRYSVTSDVFKRINTVQKGKSHGLVMFIDLSGSMTENIKQIFEQAIALTLFCKKVGIPFDVYGFSDNPGMHRYGLTRGSRMIEKKGYLMLNNNQFRIKHYLSNKMSNVEYRTGCENMIYVSSVLEEYGHFNSILDILLPAEEKLHSTPLDEAIASSISIVGNFKKSYNLDIVNCIFLTDGCGGVTNNIFKESHLKNDDGTERLVSEFHWYEGDNKFYVQYPGTNKKFLYQNKMKDKNSGNDFFISARALVEVAKYVTGAKYTGYYIGRKSEVINIVFPYEFLYISREVKKEQQKEIRKKFDSDKFWSSDKFGFDQYFFVASENLQIAENKIVVPENATKSKLTKAFMDSVKGRGIQRMFLNKFTQNIAT